MIRRKASRVGLLALALLAMGIGIPSAAQGEPTPKYEFLCLEGDTTVHCTADSEQAKVHERSEEDHLLHVGAATLTCGVVDLDLKTDADGKTPSPTSEPVYEECEDLESSQPAKVKANGCTFEYFAEAESSREGATEDEYEGSMSLVCPSEQKISIELTESGCRMDILPQTTVKPVYFRNMSGEPGDVTIETDEDQLTANVTDGFFTCGVTKEHHTAEYLGNTTLRATSEGEFVEAEVGTAPAPTPPAGFEFTCLEDEAHVACTGDGEEAVVHGGTRNDHAFHAGFISVTCNEVFLNVTSDPDGTSTTTPTEPVYSDCEDSLTSEDVHVDTNECEYAFHVEDTETRTPDEFVGTSDLVCPGDVKSITIEATNTGCQIHVPEQETIGPIYFRNMTSSSPTDVTVEAGNASEGAQVTANFTQGFFTCGVTKGHHLTEYTGNTTVRATNESGEFIDGEISPIE